MGILGYGRWCALFALVSVLGLLVGCSPPSAPPADAQSTDSAMDALSSACTAHAQCDDQLFCNGVERCMPGSAGANARGCVAGTPPCSAGTVCNEAMAQCSSAPADGGDAASCDEDGDGVQGPQCGGLDCDDRDPYRAPNQRERCDGMLPNGMPAAGHDEDCDPCTVSGSAPDGDSDGDGYARLACSNPWRSAAAPTGCDVRLAVVPASSTVRGQDCNDDPAMRGAQQNPGSAEVCGNSIDDDCDGRVDFGQLYPDLDHDNSGDRNAMPELRACALGWSGTHDDCDDTRQETYPGAREQCDGRDNTCSLPGAMAGGPLPSEDMDGDMHSPLGARCLGRGETGALGSAFPKDDCDDASPTRYTGAMEICGNGIDEDCDGIRDNPTQRVCNDLDRDGHGDMGTMRTVMSCTIPAGTVTLCDDCDDSAATGAARFPGNREVCDRIDNDCSTPSTPAAVEEDTDNDRFSPPSATCLGAGEAGAPAGAFPRTDCDDSVALTNPGAAEHCDRVDSDCSTGGGVAAEEDRDNDGWASPTAACLARGEAGASSSALPRGDCDETRANVHPGPPVEDTSVCDGLDNDCNPLTTELATPCRGPGFCSAGGLCARGPGIAEVAAGGGHSCARRNDGTVLCWGDNSAGQLGDGTMTSRSVPAVVPGLTGVVGIAAGGRHSCARRNDGAVLCWGDNSAGQLGDGTITQRLVPTAALRTSDAVELVTGSRHTCARRSDGTVLCWGENTFGRLGDGTTTNRLSPTAVPGLTGVAGLGAGAAHTCARRSDGSLYCWGYNLSGQLGDGTTTDRLSPTLVPGVSNVVLLAVGGSHNCAQRADGAVLCWGRNTEGQLGDGTTTGHPTPTVLPGLASVAALAAGFQHSCALRGDGATLCWGANNSGQLGDSTTTNRAVPATVPGVASVAGLSAGNQHTCALRGDGVVLCWGANSTGQLGDGTTTLRATATPMTDLTSAVELAAGATHTCARLSNGSVYCFGANNAGQLGDSMITPRPLPTAVPGLLPSLQQLTAAGDHTCVRLNDGSALCWGDNGAGQLGDGTTGRRSVPGVVTGLSMASELATGAAHTCAALVGGSSVLCWGSNSAGQLGDGSTTQRLVPTTVPSLTNVVELATGNGHSCARRTDGSVLCWGDNSAGQLGDGSTTNRTSPTAVPGLANASQLAAGGLHTCARRTDGTVLCWGRNLEGQLGDGTTTNRTSPTVVPGLANVLEVAAGNTHSCARRADGAVLCWGDNSRGGVGDGTTMNRSSPTAVSGLAYALELVAGDRHTCARRTDGALLCWGRGDFGQLGDGTTPLVRSTPTLLLSL